MKRIAIFAHYDKHSIIDDYVIFYLESLKKSVDKIIFVSDCVLKETELQKINHLVFHTICEKHGEYDFGSYKRGFALLNQKYQDELLEADELVFANDSCYCLRDFESIFKDVESKDCDAWSLGDDYENPEVGIFYLTKKYYLQSYFIVFRKSVFLESFFQNFLNSVKKLEHKHQIIFEYEEGLGRLLTANNKKLFAYFAANRVAHYLCDNYVNKVGELVNLIKNNSHYNDTKALFLINGSFDISKMNYIHSNKFYFLLELGSPLLKRAIICQNISTFDDEKLTFFWKSIVKKFTPFNTEIITDHLARISIKEKRPSDIISIFSKYQNHKISRYTRHYRILSIKTLFQIKRTRSSRLIVKLLKIPVINKCISKQNNYTSNSINLVTSQLKLSTVPNKKSVTRLAIFAHYDKQSIIEDYVIDYLKSLREVAKHIIFVSDCILSIEELSKLNGLVEKIIFEKHGEYDFGSYKRGLLFAINESNNPNRVINRLEDYDQLIVANDSCYLTSSLSPTFKEMTERNSADFWGMTQNTEQFLPHIQSYFVVFNKNVFLNQGFQDFFLSIRKETAKLEIIANYEVGLTQNLLELGFTKDSFVKKVFDKNPTLSEKLITEFPKDFPLIKVPLLNRILWKNANKNTKIF